MERLLSVEGRPGHRLFVVFDDGTEGEVDLSGRLKGPVLKPLMDSSLFEQVSLDEFGAPSWPNGADWAPDALYRELRQSAGAAEG